MRSAGLVAAVVAAAVFSGLAGFGGDGRTGPLAWSGDGEVFIHPTLPSDRVLSATLRNDIAVLEPSEEVPLTIAWHAQDGAPVRVDYGRGSLPLPG